MDLRAGWGIEHLTVQIKPLDWNLTLKGILITLFNWIFIRNEIIRIKTFGYRLKSWQIWRCIWQEVSFVTRPFQGQDPRCHFFWGITHISDKDCVKILTTKWLVSCLGKRIAQLLEKYCFLLQALQWENMRGVRIDHHREMPAGKQKMSTGICATQIVAPLIPLIFGNDDKKLWSHHKWSNECVIRISTFHPILPREPV